MESKGTKMLSAWCLTAMLVGGSAGIFVVGWSGDRYLVFLAGYLSCCAVLALGYSLWATFPKLLQKLEDKPEHKNQSGGDSNVPKA